VKGLRRFLADEIKEGDGLCFIRGSEARHIATVLRMGKGDHVVVMDGKGRRFLTLIDSANPREVVARIERSIPEPSPSPVEIILCQSMLKSAAMDYVVQKASELGVNRIFPFSSRRSVSRPESERLENRLRHWREIARSSAKQSDRTVPAEITPVSNFGELLARWKGIDACKIIFWEGEGSRGFKGIMRGSQNVKKFVGLVGPEGGFEKQEVDMAVDAGFISASLGSRILRAETASVAVAAIVQYEWGDLAFL